ncbi:20426_t:CDS:2, partial [Racocetra persica]
NSTIFLNEKKTRPLYELLLVTNWQCKDLIEQTKVDRRQIILIIDEAHRNKSTKLAKNIIDLIDPKIILHVTATPDERDELEARRSGNYYEVPRAEVIEQGLIKEAVGYLNIGLLSDLTKTLGRLAWKTMRMNMTFYFLNMQQALAETVLPQLKEDYKNNPNLRLGYLYTNYRRDKVRIPDESL